MPEMTENQSHTHKPQRRKKNKETHNAVERHRKKKINTGINRIGELLPCSQALKQSKNMILDQAFRYITELKQQNDTLLLNGGDKVQAEEIRRLRRQLEDLRKESAHYIELLKANGINFLDDPTVHWKGKLRRTKVAKVTPTHLVPEGIIVYSNGNVMCPVGEEPTTPSVTMDTRKQPPKAVIVQPACNIAPLARPKLCQNQAHLQDSPSSPAAQFLLAPAASAPSLVALDQHASELHTVSKLSHTVSYIAVPGVCPLPAASTAAPQQLPSSTSVPSLPLPLPVSTLPSSVAPLPPSQESTVVSLGAVPRTLNTVTQHASVTPTRTVSDHHTFRIGSTGSTQTTWTTLQLGGSTVQPFCHTVASAVTPSSTASTNPQSLQGALVCPAVPVTSIQSVLASTQIPVQPQVQTSAPVMAPSQGPLQTPTLAPLQPPVQVQLQAPLQVPLQTPAQATPQTPVQVPLQTPLQVPVQTPIQVPIQPPAQVPLQSAPTVLPLMQTMQVLQMRSPTASNASQTNSNPKVVILQPANPSPPKAVVREGLSNQTSCQHIVIIQATNQNSQQQNKNANVAPVAVTLAHQIVTSSSTASTASAQTVGGKHLVHILPRPTGSSTSSTTAPTQTPQTITVNGQVFALQAVKSPTGASSKNALQIIQPTTSEDPNTNVTLHTLGALASLNQSIAHITNQSNLQLAVASSTYPLTQPPSVPPVTTAAVHCSSPPGPVPSVPSTTSVSNPSGGPVKVLLKKPGTLSSPKAKPKRPPFKKKNPTRKTNPKPGDGGVSYPSLPTAQQPPEAETEIPILAGPSISASVTPLKGSFETKSQQVSISQTEGLRQAEMAYTNVISTVSETTVSNASHIVHEHVVSNSGSTECVPAGSCLGSTASGPTVSIMSPTVSRTVMSGPCSVECNTAVVTNVVSTQSVLAVSPVSSTMTTPIACTGNSTKCLPSATGANSTVSTATKNIICSVSSVVSRLVDSSASPKESKLTANDDTSVVCDPIATSTGFTVSGSLPFPQLNLLSGSSVGQTANPQVTLLSHQPLTLTDTSLAAIPTSCCVSTSTVTTNLLSQLSECTKTTPTTQTPISQQGSTMSGLASPHNNAVTAEPNLKTPCSENDPSEDRMTDEVLDKSSSGGEHITTKDSTPPQQVCTMEQDGLEQPLLTNRQADSPLLAGSGGGRGFSVASMLPTCHGASAHGGSFATFTFTSEQAEILDMAARAIFEQDNSERRPASCGMESPTAGLASSLIPGSASDWDLTKPQQTSHSKERVAGSQQKLPKLTETPVAKPPSQVPVEQSDEAATSVLLPVSYPQSSHSQSSQSHSQTSQTPSVGSLSVNNLIRPANSCQPYPCSPSMPQQVSAPSPIATPMTQPPVLLPPYSGTGQLSDLTPLKSALMRAAGGGAERRMKDMSKRSAQEEVMVSSSKRPKPCGTSVARMDMKVAPPDHTQMMASHLPASSGSTSAPVNRAHSVDGLNSLFPENFINSAVRQTEGHCSSQVLPQEHLQQGHPQHGTPQPTHHHSIGNPYLKQQQQQEQQIQGQRQHMYQLQHHLNQADATQLHNLHQRVLQQDQHIQKKRGMVRGGQQGPPIGLPQKQHHVEKSGPQQQQHQQNSHSRHQHLQQHLQQQQHFGSRHQEKNLLHPQQQQQDRQVSQNHSAMQRLISSRSLEQQLTPQGGSAVSRPSDISCTPSRQERHRISSYSAEALIGKSSSSGEQRMGLVLQTPRSNQDQSDLRSYLDVSRGKGNIAHNPQGRLDHTGAGDLQRVSECTPFKALSAGQYTLGNFEAQVSRGSDMASKPGASSHRGMQTQSFRMGAGTVGDRQTRAAYSGQQGVPVGGGVQQEQEGCHQSFMQSLLTPHLEQVGHQRVAQCCPPVSMEYSCVSATPSGDLQAKAVSPSIPPAQKPPTMRLSETNKGHINPQISGSMHGAATGVRTGLHPATSHSSAESGHPTASAPSRPINSVTQRSRHPGQDAQNGKLRPTGDRTRPSALRPGNPFEAEGHLPLASGGGVLLGRQQAATDTRRGSIVRFMSDSTQVGGDNLVSDQHLSQNFGFSFIPDNAASINTNPSFMPPVTQPNASRTSAIIPVEPQNPLSSFYPSYSPAAHPSLPSDIQLQYFPNQMFTSPNTEKASGTPLNNRFGSILSPPRPVGFAQASFPLLPDMPPMPIANSSSITPHLPNFNLTSLFPEIATAMPADGSSMPMSPLLSLTNTSSSDSSKQPNRPAHNISHILGHDGNSAV